MAKFADMNDARRAPWLAWANSHDWGAGQARFNAAGQLEAQCAAFDAAGEYFVETYAADCPADLRAWAGY